MLGKVTEGTVISIFPNPASGYFNLKLDNINGKPYSVLLYNTLGQEVKRYENISGANQMIDCKNLTNGLYHIEVRQNKMLIGQSKFIKE